jgi:hypothetical protein
MLSFRSVTGLCRFFYLKKRRLRHCGISSALCTAVPFGLHPVVNALLR